MTPAILENARLLAIEARLAYRAYGQELTARHRDGRLTVVERGNVRLFAVERDNAQTIVFAGTDDIFDWAGNLTAWKVVRTGIGRIHNGFADCFAQVRGDLEEILDRGERVTFAGHSLGGAMAQIAAAQAVRRGHLVESVHTFGAPLVGNGEWADFYDSCKIETHCWVAGWDRVPLQPSFFGFGLGYRRVSGWRFLSLDGRMLSKPPGILVGKPWKTWTRRQMNHAMETYIETLGNLKIDSAALNART